MAFGITNLNVDLIRNTATVALVARDPHRSVNISIPIETPGNQPENRLQEIAKETAKQALRDALAALEET